MLWVNEARENVMEFNDLLKAVPCPVTSLEGFANYMIMAFSGGTHEAVRMTKWMRDYAAEKVKKGVGGVADEKIRIAWPYTHVFFDQGLFPWIEETFNAVVIMDIFNLQGVTSEFTVLDIALVLTLSFALSALIGWIYQITHRGTSYTHIRRSRVSSGLSDSRISRAKMTLAAVSAPTMVTRAVGQAKTKSAPILLSSIP